MTAVRGVLGALGVGLAAYGAFLLLTRQEGPQVLDVALWFVVGVVLHDAVLAPLAGAVGWALPRVVPGPARAPVAAGLVVLLTVTLAAVPVLGRFGALPDNPTLLDRPYAAGWGVLAGLVTAAVVAGTVVRARRA
ncbi:hypothetical protein INN71_01345 [Nocardioides sp. ChNu-153]|uniref:hypothetical protein n=1 Tax=unclassified Nocardioides TaxID=2615069 RepID=UPI00240603D3|nr:MULTISPECIES: hypothetical protein [unclassified Nocardioides]MDF9714845.1 hypothetical protein [Nocardioides sp. ChNu-99]MDN7120029.1 hypothetical protein [Nocardioides sp. ChNu-153]